MKRKFNFKKSLLTLALGFIFCLCSMPAINLRDLLTKAELDNVYPSNESVEINGSFETSTSNVPDKWSIDSKYIF